MNKASVIRVGADELANALIAHNAELFALTKAAAVAAAYRLVVYLVQVVDSSGVNDLGTYRAGFRVVSHPDGPAVVNDAPHAGIVELGARPHKVSMEGIQAIAEWVRRKLRPTDEHGKILKSKNGVPKRFTADAALKIAWAIAKTIEKYGQKPHYFMTDAQGEAAKFFSQELERLSS